MVLNFDKLNILLDANVGFEFEFYSNYSLKKTANLLSKLLDKKITICDKAHSNFKSTVDNFKIEPDMSGGSKLIELITGSLPYQDARIILIKILNFIKDNGYTTDRCGLHINISFDEKKYGKQFLSHLNILKFILEFDENFVYLKFPKREDIVYAKSIKFIIPKNRYNFLDLRNIDVNDFIIPNEKYYGVNFKKLINNYLEFRYLGGKDYEKKVEDILELLDFFILQLYKVAKNPQLTYENRQKLNQILKNNEHLIKAYISFDEFRKYYPNISFLVDLDSDYKRIKTYWGVIRDKLFNLLNECYLIDGIINYDSDINKLQIKNANLKNNFKIEGVDLIDCDIKGILINCDVFRCNCKSAEIYKSNIFNYTYIKDSKLENCYINSTAILENCYVYGKLTIMNGKMIKGIFREGRISNLSQFEDTEIIEAEKINNKIDARY